MSRLISDILGVSSPGFHQLLMDWERRSGDTGHDVRLISDIRLRSKKAVEDLGFSGMDATAREIYYALQERAILDKLRLAESLGISEADEPVVVMEKILDWLDKQRVFREVWVLKTSLVKNKLSKKQPRSLMRALGLRSCDSMLKRNNPAEVLPLAYALEKPEWATKFRESYKKLSPMDFQAREVSIYLESTDRVVKLEKAGYPVSRIVTPCYETGSLVLIPPKERFLGDVLAIIASIIEAIAEIRRHSAYYRTIGVRKDFGLRFLEVCQIGIVAASQKLAHVGWGSLHKHLVGNEEFFARVEQPHLVHADLHASSAVDVLKAHDTSFAFWDGLDHVFFVNSGDKPVSMHLIDVVANASNRMSYEQSINSYGRARLWDELWSRYLRHEPLAEQITEQFLK